MNKCIVKYESEYGTPPAVQVTELGESVVVRDMPDLPSWYALLGWKASDTEEIYQPGDELVRLPYEDAISLLECFDWNCSMELQKEFDNYLISHVVLEWLKFAAPNDKRVLQHVAFWEVNRDSSERNILFTLNSRKHSVFRDRSDFGWL
jgi:hypothetical protein